MPTVRELVTKLSFNVDKRGIENFNRSILGFKTKFAIAQTAVAGFITSVARATKTAAEGVLDTDELARRTEIAGGRLIGLQRAAEQFGISPDQFAGAFGKLSELVKDAEQGFGDLRKIAAQSGIEITDQNGRLLSTEQIFKNIIEFLGTIDRESTRIDIAKNIFGVGRFANIATEGVESFKKLAKASETSAEQFEENRKGAIRFSQSFTQLKNNIAGLAERTLPTVFEGFSNFFKSVNDLIDETNEKGFFQTLGNQLNRELRKVSDFLGIPDNIRNLINTQQNQPGAQNAQGRTLNVNSTIEVNVPAGTEESQRAFLEDSARQAFDENFNNRFDEILNNFPEVT